MSKLEEILRGVKGQNMVRLSELNVAARDARHWAAVASARLEGYVAGFCTEGEKADNRYSKDELPKLHAAWEEGREMGYDDWIPF